jgi:hypothetical protein
MRFAPGGGGPNSDAATDDLATADPSASQCQRPALRPVITPTVDVLVWHTAKLAHRDHERRFEQSSVRKILQENRQTLIELRDEASAVFLVVVRVRVPLIKFVAGSGHEAAAVLHQPSGEQHALSEPVKAVRLLGLLRLLRKVESALDLRRQNHPQRLLGERI